MEGFGRSNLTHDDIRFEKLFKRAAKSAMLTWRNGDSEGYTDLANELWVRVLESTTTQEKLYELSNYELISTLKSMAYQILSREQGQLNVFRQLVLYSSDNVKEALNGKSTNWGLVDVLPEALKELSSRNYAYCAAIESRFRDKIPQGKAGPEAMRLSRALRSLTEIVNALCISTTSRDGEDKLRAKDGPGSRNGKFPQDGIAEDGQAEPRRRSKGTHSDPTATLALALLSNPEIRDELFETTPITEYCKGPSPVITLPDGRKYRPSRSELNDPKLVEKVVARLA
jgi:hypothetical protein